ncbi:helicase C-terminal domain-containing protein [Desulfovibrio sp. ZJ200]|uniref:helicase C-terminal domain-containing protein n=1 Tax=Desulfovibrio sp. ZJ200 TaxID=2709792 RepID=UPI0013ECA67D|nr:helicase C-terminal domain-containing protein [Desulfovibrio sp. ZJ200]
MPELLSMYRTFADVVTRSDLDEQAKQAGERPLTPPVRGGKPVNEVVERSDDQATYMGTIIFRMENLPKDPHIDNPLKVTNDARKAGLDFRLIKPSAEDFEGSKLNTAVARIYDIWRETSADKGTQLVFCDLSTPKGGKAPASAQSERQDLESGALIDVDGTFVRETPEQEDMAEDDGDDALAGVVNMDEVIAMSSGKFSVYDDMKQKLMAKGIPAEEIAFIHDANTDIRKAKLFADMNAGRVRILLGSTAKMGAGMNVQKRLVAAHHLDAPWRPSDLEQRNGRIIRQGNMFYERDPDTFSVQIYNYATKQTYDARMWQCIEYKSAAIEQFRKGDLLQRVIDDVSSEAANAAEMKAAASGNPLILMQVQLASDLRKLEALYSQHQRGQHRMRDRLKYLASAESRLAKAEADYAENIQLRDANTRTMTEKGKEKILVELVHEGKVLGDRDGEKMRDILVGGIKEVTRNSGAKVLFGTYRGFTMTIIRSMSISSYDGFRIILQGAGDQQFQPDNLRYSFDDKLSLSGLFQRVDNFLGKGLDESIEKQRERTRQERAELETVKAALGKAFPQQEELALTRENHNAVMRELQRMQDDPNYVSTWTPKTCLTDEQPTTAEAAQPKEADKAATPLSSTPLPAAPKENQSHTLKYGEGEGRTEYTVSNQHNGYTLEGYVLRRSYFNNSIGSLGQSLYEDGQWHTTATVPQGVKLRRFASLEEGAAAAREDAARRGLKETPPAKMESKYPFPPIPKTVLAFGEGDSKIEYAAYEHSTHHVLERAHFRNATRWPVYTMYDDDHWHTCQDAPRYAVSKKFKTAEDAMTVARQDAATYGIAEAMTQTVENFPSNADASQSYHDRLVGTGFSASGSDFYGKNEHALTLEAEDGGSYELRVFQTGNDKIGLRVQYEKNNIINGARTVHATFDSLAEALEHVEAYRQLTAPQVKAAVQTASPSGGVPGFVISRPRMR